VNTYRTTRTIRLGLAAAVLVTAQAATTLGWAGAAHAVQATTRLSVNSNGQQANGTASNPAVNLDGTVVAFSSIATNLIGVHMPHGQVYLRNQARGATEIVSRSTAGGIPDGRAVAPSISENGRLVAFQSAATNLVPGDTNGADDIFVRDVGTGITTRVSVSSSNAQGNAASSQPAISGDGRWVAFASSASNLVAGDTNGRADVFVHDRVTGTTTKASTGPAGAQSDNTSSRPSISRDGSRIAFHSSASNLLAKADTNGTDDVFVASATLVIERASESSGSVQGNFSSRNAAISADGRTVVFDSGSSNLVPGDTNGRRDIFRYETVTGLTTLVSATASGGFANGESLAPSISGDGRRVAYSSTATNLVGSDANGATSDAFVTDLSVPTGARTTLVSVSGGGAAGNGASASAALSHNGLVAAFHSSATNLVSGDTNATLDVFARTQ